MSCSTGKRCGVPLPLFPGFRVPAAFVAAAPQVPAALVAAAQDPGEAKISDFSLYDDKGREITTVLVLVLILYYRKSYILYTVQCTVHCTVYCTVPCNVPGTMYYNLC